MHIPMEIKIAQGKHEAYDVFLGPDSGERSVRARSVEGNSDASRAASRLA